MPETVILDYEQRRSATRRRAIGVLMLVVASIFWSLSGVAVKTLKLPPITFTLYRSLGAAAAMAAVIPLFPGRRPRAGWMALSAVLYTAVVTLLILAMTLGTAAVGILLQYTAPIWCALLAWCFQRRRIDGRTLMALAVAAVGVTIMIAGQGGGGSWAGPTYGLLSGIAFGGLILILEKLNRSSGRGDGGAGGVNPAMIVLFNNIGPVAVLLPMAIITHQLAGVPGWKVAAVLGVGIVQLGVPYILFQLALRRVTPVDASLLTLLEPLLNPVWVALATAERPDIATYVGGGAIVIALVLEATKKGDAVGSALADGIAPQSGKCSPPE